MHDGSGSFDRSKNASIGATVVILVGLYGLALPVALLIVRLLSPGEFFLAGVIALAMVMATYPRMIRLIAEPSPRLKTLVSVGYLMLAVTLLVLLVP